IARAASGHAVAPPSSVMNSRRFMGFPTSRITGQSISQQKRPANDRFVEPSAASAIDLPGGNPMFDKFGRLLCPTCGEPMTRAANFDSHRGGVMRRACAGEIGGAVVMLVGRVSRAEAEDQRAA